MNEPQRPESTRPPLAGFLPVARRWRWMLLAAALAAGVAGYVTAAGSGRAYESRADILVGSVNTADIDTLRASGQLAETYAELATSRPLLQATERRLGLRDVGSNITVTANPTTRLLTVAVRNADKKLAANIANTHAEELVGLAQRRRAEAEGPGTLQLVDPAVPSSSPGSSVRSPWRFCSTAPATPSVRRRTSSAPPASRAWRRCHAGRCAPLASSAPPATGPHAARPPAPTACSRPRSRSSPGRGS
jgi:hypothetical protein